MTPGNTKDSKCAAEPILNIAGSSTYLEKSVAINVMPAAEITFNANITSALVTLDDVLRGDAFAVSYKSTSVTVDVAQGAITMTGDASVAEYQKVLQSVKFSSDVENDFDVTRKVTLTARVCRKIVYTAAHTKHVCSDEQQSVVHIQAFNDRPCITFKRNTTNIPVVTASFIQEGGPVRLLPPHPYYACITDKDHKEMASASITIKGVSSGDTLIFPVRYPTIGVRREGAQWILYGKDTIERYQKVMSAVKFESTVTEGLHTATRTAVFRVTDPKGKTSDDADLLIVVCSRPGYFADTFANIATRCPQGRYQPKSCTTTCIGCGYGTFGSAQLGRNSDAHCELCPAGKFGTTVGAKQCTACAKGTYGPVASTPPRVSASHCKNCPAGKIQELSGKTSCVACDAATQYSSSDRTMCKAYTNCCDAFRKVIGHGADDGWCAACPQGQHKRGCSLTRECTKCAAGKAGDPTQEQNSEHHCHDCGAQQGYSDVAGAASCKPWVCCNKGKYRVGASSTTHGSCTRCAGGKYQDSTCQTKCSSCPRGTFGNSQWTWAHQQDARYCEKCQYGQYQPKKAQTSCLKCSATCPQGKYIAIPCNATNDRFCADLPLIQTGGTVTYVTSEEERQADKAAGLSTRPESAIRSEIAIGGMSEAAFNSMGRESLRVAIAKQAFPLLPLAEALSRVILDADVTNARRRLQEQNGAFKVSFTIVASSEAERANVEKTVNQTMNDATAGAQLQQDMVQQMVASGNQPPASLSAAVDQAPTVEDAGVPIAPAGIVSYQEKLQRMVVSLVNATVKDEIFIVDTAGLVYDEAASAGGVVVLHGTATPGVYQQALRNILFRTSDDIVRVLPITVEVCAVTGWGNACSAKDTSAVQTTLADKAPKCFMQGVGKRQSARLTFTQGGSRVTVTPNLDLRDKDSTRLRWATIVVFNNQPGDMLIASKASTNAALSVAYNESIGELRISGNGTLSDYEQVLRSVQFYNDRELATAGGESGLRTIDRQIACQADDGENRAESAPAVTISICTKPGYSTILCPTCEVFGCRGGTYSTGGVCKSQCVGCAAGSVSPPRTASCEQCSRGTFFAPATEDDRVPAHGKVGVAGQLCKACKAGEYSATLGAFVCVACQAGKYGSGTDHTSEFAQCSPCEPGTYSSAAASTRCKPWKCCRRGSFNFGASSSAGGTCQGCPSGKFRNAPSCVAAGCKTWKKKCPAGKYLNGATPESEGSCVQCGAGKFKTTTDAWRSCTGCPAGRFGSVEGATAGDVCKVCPTGKYQTYGGQNRCESCCADCYGDPAVPTSSAAHCKKCEFGSWGSFSMCSKSCVGADGKGGTRMRVRQVLSQGEHALKQCQATESRTCSSDRKCPQNCVHVSCRYRRHPTTGQYAVQVFHHRKGSDDYVHHCKIYEQQGRNECVCSCDAFYSSGTQGSPLSPIVPAASAVLRR